MKDNIKIFDDQEPDIWEKEEETGESISVYLYQTAPLLSAEEEIELAKQIEKGSSEAVNRFIESNIRLVKSIANHYCDMGLPYEDLVQEGMIGLCEAVLKFDYKRGTRFSTYGSYWIRQSIIRALENQARVVRLPIHVEEKIFRLKKIENSLSLVWGRKPTNKEISEAMNLSIDEIVELRKLSQYAESLDRPVGKDDDKCFGDTLEDNKTVTPEEALERKMLKEALAALLRRLTLKQRIVLIYRFGLYDVEPMTLEAIGDMLGVSRERVRQIEAEALRKIKSYKAGLKKLEDYADN